MLEQVAFHRVEFDVLPHLKDRIIQESRENPSNDLFSLSLLTTPNSSPTATPGPSPSSTPTISPVDLPLENSHFTQATDPPPLTAQERLKRRRTLQGRNNWAKRQCSAKHVERGGPPVRKKAKAKYAASSTLAFTSASAADSHVARSGYMALNRCTEVKEEYSLDELLKLGFGVLKWDGSTRILLVDRSGYVIGILGGKPEDENWQGVQDEAQEQLQGVCHRLSKPKKGNVHRRGNFPTLCCGVFYGGGQKCPMNLQNCGRRGNILAHLNSQPCFERFASFGSSVFQSCAPQLHGYNLGPQVVCFPHVDFANLPFGFCAITAIGNFDPSNGGHLALWDCKLAIQFPPGSMALILSGVLTHSNAKVAAHEARFSFTQYCAGGLFRWVDHGFQSAAYHRASLSKEEFEAWRTKSAGSLDWASCQKFHGPILSKYFSQHSNAISFVVNAFECLGDQAIVPDLISMPQVPCFCDFAQCGGAMIDSQTFDRHKRHDLSKRVRDSVSVATDVCKNQDDVITAYFASLSLSSGHSTNPSASSTTINTYSSMSGKSTEQKQVQESLDQLRDIETSLDDLISSINTNLSRMGHPRAANDVFPLLSSTLTARRIQAQLSGIVSHAAPVRETKSSLLVRLGEVVTRLDSEQCSWRRRAEGLPVPTYFSSDTTFNTEQHNAPILQNADLIIQVAVFTMVVLQVILHNSRRSCHFVLSMLQYMVQLCLLRNGRNLNVYDQKLLADFPKDPDSATKQFKLGTKEVIYAVCPKHQCQSLHRPVYQGSPIPQYPMFCTNKPFNSDSECGTRITRPWRFGSADADVPIKRFVTFSFRNYIAELTSRSGFEDRMDAAWKGSQGCNKSPAEMHDVFDGEFLRDFKGRDGRPFGLHPQEGHYVFSLSTDFFNPFTNKQAGKSVSFGVISIVCLNLPVSMRYRPENMFLAGVIPGPKELPLTLHQYLSPIVDEFLEFWDPGIRLSRTCKFPGGRLILCALILVICDLLAARKTIGYAACTHEHFCNMCDCTRSVQGYGRTDCNAWGRRSNKEWRKAATEFQACRGEDEKVTKFNETGVRWSELLRLPYFDIARCVVVDPMHNLFLGLIKEHFNGILGLIPSKSKNENRAIIINLGIPSTLNQNDVKGVEKLRCWLEKPAATFSDRVLALKKLQHVNLLALAFMCQELRCNIPLLPLPTEPQRNRHTKAEFAEALLSWRFQQPEMQIAGANTSTEFGHVLQPKKIEEIRSDINQLLTPTWMTSVPSNISHSSHGKLKVDQWRALGMTHLLISLIRLWGFNSDNSACSARCLEILDVTISLISAVIIATSRTATPASASAYQKHMVDYINGIKQLFPSYQFHPNHHMSLHISEFLLLFGPVHSWWTFAFERLIGNLQRMPSNGKVGEMEETIAHAYIRSANLRALLLKSGCPEAIQHCKPFVDHLLNPQLRDSLVTDIHAISAPEEAEADFFEGFDGQTSHPVPAEIRAALHSANLSAPSRVALQTYITINGLKFATASKHPGNSCIMISSESGDPQPCQLFYILEFGTPKSPSTYLAIRRFKPANVSSDPFSKYPVLRAKLWDSTLADVEIIAPFKVLSHFACLSIRQGGHSFNAVLSLSRTYIPDHPVTNTVDELATYFERFGLD